MYSNVIRILQQIAATSSLVVSLSRLKLWFYVPTSTLVSLLPRADFKSLFHEKNMCMANIFHMPPWEAM